MPASEGRLPGPCQSTREGNGIYSTWARYTYDHRGLLLRIEEGSEGEHEPSWRYEYTYDEDGRPLSVEATDLGDGRQQHRLDYGYDEKGRLVGASLVGDIWGGKSTIPPMTGFTFVYNDWGQVVGAYSTRGAQIACMLDVDGRLVAETELWGRPGPRVGMRSTTYTLDQDGRRVAERQGALGYTERRTWHTYDARGNRVRTVDERTESRRTTHYDYGCWDRKAPEAPVFHPGGAPEPVSHGGASSQLRVEGPLGFVEGEQALAELQPGVDDCFRLLPLYDHSWVSVDLGVAPDGSVHGSIVDEDAPEHLRSCMEGAIEGLGFQPLQGLGYAAIDWPAQPGFPEPERLFLEAPNLSGPMPRAVVDAAVVRVQEALQSCGDQAPELRSWVWGNLDFVIDERGRVQTSSTSSDLPEPVSACLTEVIEDLRAAPSPSSPVRVVYPVRVGPGSD